MADLEARDLWKLFILTNLLLARGDSLPLDLYDLYIYCPLRQASGRASELSCLAPSFLLVLLWCNNKLICWQESYPTEHRLQTASPTAHQPSRRHNPEISLTPGPLEDCGFLHRSLNWWIWKAVKDWWVSKVTLMRPACDVPPLPLKLRQNAHTSSICSSDATNPNTSQGGKT